MTQPREIRYVTLAEVQPAERNPRLHESIDGVKASIARFGFVEGAVHDGRTGRIIAGHGRLEALTAMEAAGDRAPEGILVVDGRWQMPLQYGWSSRSDAEAEALLVNLNRLTETGGWNYQELADLLSDLRGEDPDLLALSGYDDEDLDKLLTDLANAQPDTDHGDKDLDDVPELQATPRSVAGDVWLLGEHRLAVGDSTDPAVFRALMGTERADLVWTDPPYGVAYYHGMTPEQAKVLNHRTDGLTVSNDTLTGDALRALLADSLGLASDACRAGACWYVACPTGEPILEFGAVLKDLGIWRHTLVWVKHRFVFGQADYHYRHEGLLYGWKPGEAHHAVPDRTQDTVWEFDMPHRSTEHPTMKPVELVVKAIKNSSDVGDIVLDPFAGSGTTLIASEMTRRKARLIELDPRYADVICRRFQLLTGQMPALERTGEVHDFAVIAQSA